MFAVNQWFNRNI